MTKKKSTVVEIKSWLDGSVLATGEEGETLRDVVVRKVAERANLSRANLSRANLSRANLPSPTAVLLAMWGDLSPQLAADLMLYDSTCHPDPEAFQRWADGGACPYADVHVGRAANFSEKRKLWGQGQHHATVVALTGRNRAKWSGKVEESEVFAAWLATH